MQYAARTRRLAGALAALLLAGLGTAPAGPRADVPIIPEAWKSVPDKALTPAEIDRLLAEKLRADQKTPAPPAGDEQFLRRVSLDLTGKLPTPAQVQAFVKDVDPAKRAKLIDRLLDSDDFARNWARYWRDVIVSRATNQQIIVRLPRSVALETWFVEQFRKGRNWAAITRDLITAEGALEVREPEKNGAVAFLLCHTGPDAAVERAAETSRVFLGIQIQCAQCHNHPSDIWKRDQFHAFAAFYGRTRERPMPIMGANPGIRLVSAPFGEYRMPGKDDPNKSTVMQPRFLTGQALGEGKGDLERRRALADLVTSRDNYWFAAAFVNRTWSELLGQAFYQPVDNVGPLQEATYPDLLLRLAGSFRATDYNVKELFRTITNTQAYQRQMRPGASSGEHLRFAGVLPTRLRADALWEALVAALGAIPDPPRPGPGMGGGQFAALFARYRPGGVQAGFKLLFDFDPSTRPDEVEGSVPQALVLMNNPFLAGRMKASGDTVLARILKEHPANEEAVRQVYLHTLGRRPTPRELEKCVTYIRQTGQRGEAFEDILWALINSTEFQTKL
jgi:hypothetical protein